MLDILEKELKEQKVFDGELPPILKKVVESIPNNDIPFRMND